MSKSKQADKTFKIRDKATEKALLLAYNASLKTIRGELAALYEKTDGSFSESQKYNRLAGIEEAIADEIKDLTGKIAKTLVTGLLDSFKEARSWKMYEIESDQSVQATIKFNQINREAVLKAIENPFDQVGFVQRNRNNQALLVQQLQQEIAQGLIQGKSFQQTARSMKKRMEIGASKALTITRTESKRVRGKAQLDTMREAQEAGVMMKKQWMGTIDDKTRDAHQSLDGVTIDLDEDFVSDAGNSGPGPGQMNAAEEDINCRCTLTTVIEGFEPDSRRVRDAGIVDYSSFEKWQETREVPKR
ncbi:SPP1 gp7 family putative phage head morphogenesis protein [Planomicrobium soli]|uniref:SPP1 gp7 family putative phage head morphogenesis protein n=1 Tax=Planomicrobium soli TaxID=1176648 RepID=A0A2P8H7C0_9BACL|nr:phage minor head protein [Planomicrobium soli]PSL42135.1 SPP1 gp7 family putative phage head morphogenesis protein [Planomicrobium soli]